MAKLVVVAVVSIGKLSPSKYNSSPYRKIIFKEPSSKKKYSLNLNQYDINNSSSNYDNWMNNLVPGAVLEVSLLDQNKYPGNISQFHKFTVMSRPEKSSFEEITKDSIDDDIQHMQFKKIVKLHNALGEAIRAYQEENNKKS